MYLKNVQLVGFKSFADKTDLEFLRGVTAIVGPNGCGKSNVSDAIRWVLGEQSAKALRGDEMADVIFSGTDGRKSYGMAEVSLTFTECGDVLKTGDLAGMNTHFDEVTVTRRIFRDGNSEYFLNRTACRLKDIQTLFMGTGIGRASYSFMEQGRIDKVLSSHPEDRRAVFEEAAGITRFKTQKKEALRKLEYTEANLLRVADIIREVKRQINSLQRQASKARRYQVLTSELKQLDTQLARHQFEEIQKTTQALEQQVADLRSRMDDVHLEIEAGEGNITNLREQAGGLETRRQEVLQRQRDIQTDIERHEIRIRTNAERISETQTTIQTAGREATDARNRAAQFGGSIGTVRAGLQAASDMLQRQAAELDQVRASLQELEKAERDQAGQVEQLQTKLLGLEGKLAGFRNEVTALDRQRQEKHLRIQKLAGERAVAEEERRRVSQRLDLLRGEIESHKHSFEQGCHAITGGEDSLREAESHCQNIVVGLAEAQRRLSERASRREVLCELEKSYEGYPEGAQAILRQVREASHTRPTDAILGTLASLIEVEPRFSTAIEAGLGKRLEAIVVADFRTALQLIDDLKNGELGRALFAVQQNGLSNGADGHTRTEAPAGSLAWARDVVRPQPAIQRLVEELLADMVIAQDLHQAIELHRRLPGLTVVTTAGEVLTHHGILSGGAGEVLPSQVLGRRREIAALSDEMATVEAEIRDLSRDRGEWEKRRHEAHQSLGDRQTELRFRETDLTRKEALLESLQTELQEIASRIMAIELEIKEQEKTAAENDSIQQHVRQDLAETEQQQAQAGSELSAGRFHSDDLAAQRRVRAAAVSDLGVAHATACQQIHGMENSIRDLESRVKEALEFADLREGEIRHNSQRIDQWQTENTAAQEAIQGRRSTVAAVAADLAVLEKDQARLNHEMQATIEVVRGHRNRLEQLQKEGTDLEVKLTEKRGDLSHLADRVSREHGADVNTLSLLPFRPELKGKATPKEAAPEPEDGPPPASAGQPPTWLPYNDWQDVALRIEELRAKVQAMGAVNLEAVQEYEELEQRHQFLTKEHQDLTVSKEQLHEILRKINITTRKMFAETFEAIRKNFQSVFSELFGGGRADLILMDESDPLECGIEIVAKPSGKQLRSIMLLSGGERTMTAVALLFAIYMVKPSPFCVLDEMDAPLDESNIDRFIRILERFLQQSQFLLITHNKRTIAMADALYGVTMEERGISKIVSVKFHRRDEPTAPVRVAEGYREGENAAANGGNGHGAPVEAAAIPAREG